MSLVYAYELQMALDGFDESQKQRVIDEAIECYEYTVDLASRDSAAKIYSTLGTLRKRKGEFDKALDAYQRSLERDSKSAATYFKIGNLRAKMHNHAAAEDAFLTSIRLDPAYDKPRVSYGWLLQGKGRMKEAKLQYREALELENLDSTTKATIHANMGIMYHEIFVKDGHSSACDDAVHHYSMALTLNDDKEAKECLSLLEARKTNAFLKKRDEYFPKEKKSISWIQTIIFLIHVFLGILICLGKNPFSAIFHNTNFFSKDF